ncbi:MAG: hypothetical protein Q4P15_10475 [Propionibacteriaceae bacterium]|nr:hypothetical protein [Propionibacteriaceae bacterium]
MATNGTTEAKPNRFRVTPRMWVGLAIAVIALAFIFQNRDPVVTQLLVFRIEAAHWVTLLAIFLVGMGTSWLIFHRQK